MGLSGETSTDLLDAAVANDVCRTLEERGAVITTAVGLRIRLEYI